MLAFFGDVVKVRLDFVILGGVLERPNVCVVLDARAHFEVSGIGDNDIAKASVD